MILHICHIFKLLIRQARMIEELVVIISTVSVVLYSKAIHSVTCMPNIHYTIHSILMTQVF